ncbi:MAG: putative lipid II flippase FtsW, partial [Halanaerobiaceae bacterium]
MNDENNPDYILIFVILTLLVIGLIMLLSASSVRALNLYNDSFYFFKNQLVSAIIGIGAMFLFMQIDYKIYKKLAKPILLISLLGLISVMVPGIGKTVGGSRRWISLGLINFQPSELAKLGLIIYLAEFIAERKEKITDFFQGILPPVIILGIIFFLILLEPDLGTAVTITGTVFIILFAAGAELRHLALLILTGMPLITYFILNEEYRRERLLAFLNPWSDPLDTGYHIIQSLMALGSGGIFGVGLGNSHQKFLYLPEPGTDFIFAVLGEEMGLLGTVTILLLFFILGWRGCKIALSVNDVFGTILATGITSMIILQAIINIGVVTASMPITGINLPFISYGGTSLVIMLSAIGILLNISLNSMD